MVNQPTKFVPSARLADPRDAMQGLTTEGLAGGIIRGNTVEWKTMRDTLDHVNRMAMNDLLSIMRYAQTMNAEEQRAFLVEAYRMLVSTYGGASADITAQWFTEIVGYDGAIPAGMPSWEQLTKEVAWGLAADKHGRSDLVSRLALLMQKRVFGAHRDTVSLNSLRTQNGWQRYARADACAFCRVLASRGAVYGSRTRATLVGMAGSQAHYSDGSRRGRQFKAGRVRGVRKAGETYHDHCRCVLIPESEHDVDYPEAYDFELQYLKAWEIAEEKYPDQDKNMKLITKVMRENGMGA